MIAPVTVIPARAPISSSVPQPGSCRKPAPTRADEVIGKDTASAIRTPGAHFKGLLTVAIDGTYLDVPDNPLHRARLGKTTNQYATSGYPQICLSALVACGTRAVMDAAFGPRSKGETVYGKRLMRSVHAGMIVLLDRGFSSNAFLAAVAATEAAFLVRVTAVRKPPVLARYDDGSYLSRFGDLKVRIIECEITVTTSQGHQRGLYRLATNLLDHHRYPASELVTLYHERWGATRSRTRLSELPDRRIDLMSTG